MISPHYNHFLFKASTLLMTASNSEISPSFIFFCYLILIPTSNVGFPPSSVNVSYLFFFA